MLLVSKNQKICLNLSFFSLRFPKSDRLLVIPFRNSKALPSSMTIIFCLPATVLDPGNPDIYSPYRLYQFRLPVSENLGQLLNWLISGLPTFTLVVADRLLPYSFIVFVTLHYVQFRSRLVVNLYLGWLLQLDCLSLPWHTHLKILL